MVRVYLAPERLSQIVENLLANALDFSPPNEAVDISVQRQGNEAILQIEDRGPGTPSSIWDGFLTDFLLFGLSRTERGGPSDTPIWVWLLSKLWRRGMAARSRP
ncbi:hypothetical protein ES703_102062 [subsurface metagenome]